MRGVYFSTTSSLAQIFIVDKLSVIKYPIKLPEKQDCTFNF